MSDAAAALVAAVERTTALRARVLPLFAGPHALPFGILQSLDAMIVDGASGASIGMLGHSCRIAAARLRLLHFDGAADNFAAMADALAAEAQAWP